MRKDTIASDIIISPRAAAEILALKEENEVPDECALRVSARPGGCSGPGYALGFDAVRRDDDIVIETAGITVLLDPRSLLLIAGTEIDYADGGEGRGFVFHNPNAGCGLDCGSSCPPRELS
jgi:iron-sulfur cluster assembly protein